MKPCCANLENRVAGHGPRGDVGMPSHEDAEITHCRVCECRHVEVTLDPGQLGVVGMPLWQRVLKRLPSTMVNWKGIS